MDDVAACDFGLAMPGSKDFDASCAGLTRASILFVKALFAKGMDCRVKPGNDGL
jgi:hypothetical protein